MNTSDLQELNIGLVVFLFASTSALGRNTLLILVGTFLGVVLAGSETEKSVDLGDTKSVMGFKKSGVIRQLGFKSSSGLELSLGFI